MVSLAITLSLRHSAQAYATRARKSAAEGYWRCAAEEFATASGLWGSIQALKDGHLTIDWIKSVYPNLETKTIKTKSA